MAGLITSIILAMAQAAAAPSAGAAKADGPSWPVIQGYAKCLVDQWPGVVQDITNVFPGSAEYKAAIAPLAKSACTQNTELNVPSELVRGGLFQALYAESYPDKAPPLAASPLNLDADVRGQPESRASSFIVLRRYGECVVRDNPEAARVLTLTTAGTSGETDALATLQPTLNRCLTSGNSVSFSKAVLTGIIAEVLYRLSVPSWR